MLTIRGAMMCTLDASIDRAWGVREARCTPRDSRRTNAVLAKIAVCITLSTSFAQSGFTLEKPEPPSMEELSDPDSPSYVPRPYPKTRDQVIQDATYALGLCETRAGDGPIHVVGDDVGPDLYSAVRSGDAIFGELITVRDRTPMWHAKRLFYLEICSARDKRLLWAYVVLDDSGKTLQIHRWPKPTVTTWFKPESEVRALFEEKFRAPVSNLRLQLESVRGLDAGRPVWRVEVHGSVLYFRNQEDSQARWYRVVRSVPLPEETEFVTMMEDGLTYVVKLRGQSRAVPLTQIRRGQTGIPDPEEQVLHILDPVP